MLNRGELTYNFRLILKDTRNFAAFNFFSKGKKIGGKSSAPIGVIIPVVIAVVIVGAMVSVYYIRRKRMESRVRKTLSQSKLVSVSNDNYTYRDLDTHDDNSIEDPEDIFPSS